MILTSSCPWENSLLQMILNNSKPESAESAESLSVAICEVCQWFAVVFMLALLTL